ncbi:MAG: single-stranded DNA-binding protein [Mobiluncus sp.]|uniref:single-stranded DNA-binding protein n=1 Tax=Mobiluncus sp. TaxID=47293 RepID=UPI00258CCABE|nr:single-stranded DNA-binding protein [Mobiluncus sp.]MCI6583642.1 single-stranded DNA-binding protein [Mobiluncus sp.]
MSSMNVTVNGRLGNTPMLREGASGTKWVKFSLATSSNYRDQDGKWRESETIWFNCKAWGALALNIAKSLHKGDPVVAQGRIVVGTYDHTDKNTGVVSERADIALHLTHIGIDLVHAATLNVKYAEEKKPEETTSFDLEPGEATSPALTEVTEVPDELVEEIDEVEESSLVGAAAGVPF